MALNLYHSTHILIPNPLGILTINLIAFLRLGIFWLRKSNPDVILFQNIKNRDTVLTGRFHADIRTVVFGKPVTQTIQTFGEGKRASL